MVWHVLHQTPTIIQRTRNAFASSTKGLHVCAIKDKTLSIASTTNIYVTNIVQPHNEFIMPFEIQYAIDFIVIIGLTPIAEGSTLLSQTNNPFASQLSPFSSTAPS